MTQPLPRCATEPEKAEVRDIGMAIEAAIAPSDWLAAIATAVLAPIAVVTAVYLVAELIAHIANPFA